VQLAVIYPIVLGSGLLVTAVILVLFIGIVLLHEWGHFIAAKKGGVDVEEFSFGFPPPRLWARKWRGTIYSFNAWPLGGFVRLKGEDGYEQGPRSFGRAKYWAKTRILLAGVGMNLVTAFVMFYVLCVVGIPALGSQFEPHFLKSAYAQPKQLILAEVDNGSPAAGAGLKTGDFVLAANGAKLETGDDLFNFTKANAGKEVTLHVRSGGDERDVQVKLRPPGTTTGFLGVIPQQVYKLRYDPLSAVAASAYITASLFVATVVGVVQFLLSIPVLVMGLFAKHIPHQAEAVSGPLGIILILTHIAELGYAYIFLFMANISVALAAFNVLPIPALDGGRWALLTVQKISRRRMSPELEAKIHTYGFMALIALIALVTVYDIRKPH
jgi:regulator of sigma E protease